MSERNDTALNHDAERGARVPDVSAVENLESNHQNLRRVISRLADFGDSPAVLMLRDDGERCVSYTELSARIERLTFGLIRKANCQGKRVAILASNSAEWIAACLAVINAGGVAVPIDAKLDKESLKHVLADSAPHLIITETGEREGIESVASHEYRLFCLDDDSGLRALCDSESVELPRVKQEDPAVIFYTSGTTGPPKGVPLSHGNLMYQLESLQNVGLMAPGERLLLPLPLHHVYPFVVGMLASLVYGVTIVLPQSMTGPHIAQATKVADVSTILGVPRLYQALLKGVTERAARNWSVFLLYRALLGTSLFARRRLGIRLGQYLFRPLHRRLGPDLRLLASGGAALEADLAWQLESLGWTVTTGYGLTETSPLLTLVPPGDRRFDTQGRPIPGCDLRIVPRQNAEEQEEDEAAAQRNETVGEIQAKGPNVFAGYLNLPERTAEAFTEDGWYRTEDQGWIDDKGYLHVLGRASTFVVTPAGKNISLEELERAYSQHPAIKEIGIFMRDRALAAAVVPDASALRQTSSEDYDAALRDAVRDQARQQPEYKRIGDLVVSREALARTRLGKIRRDKLRERFDDIRAGRDSSKAQAGPVPLDEMSGEDQALLEHAQTREVWNLLGERSPEIRLSPDSDVTADLGIDSLEWINVTLDIRDRTGVVLSEEATSRIESVRDLLEEVLESSDEPRQSAADLTEEPEQHITDRQKRWLKPLNSVETALAWLFYHLNRLIVRSLFRLKVSGLENLRSHEQVILTPNHVSFLDPFVIAAALPYDLMRRSAFAGWTGIAFANPLFRFVVRLARTVPIETNRAAFSSLALAFIILRRGENLTWFAEGARSRDGSLQAVQPGIGVLIANESVPVVPVIIKGTFECMPVGQWLPKPRPVTVRIGKAILPADLETKGRGESKNARIADAIHQELKQLKSKSDV